MFEPYRAIGMLKEIASQLKEEPLDNLQDSALSALEETISRMKLLCD